MDKQNDDFYDENGSIKTGQDFLEVLLKQPNVKHINKKFEDTTLDDILEN